VNNQADEKSIVKEVEMWELKPSITKAAKKPQKSSKPINSSTNKPKPNSKNVKPIIMNLTISSNS
jgi:hypothetical protein